jgi:pentatricopeptide repeat protein
MGIWDLLRKKIANEAESHHGDYTETITKNIYELASFDMENASLVDKIQYLLDNRSQGEQIQFADKLLREGPFEMSIRMYEALIKKYPEERDRYENGIGSAYVKLGQYEKAIEFYLKAKSHGMHPDISDKHIWDACQKQYKHTGQSELLENYHVYSPEGKYLSQAETLLKEAGKWVEPPTPAPEQKEIAAPESEEKPVKGEVTENPYIQPSESIADVAKKDKIVPPNQISLFGFDEPEKASKETVPSPQKEEQQAEETIPQPANPVVHLIEESEEEGDRAEEGEEIFAVRPNMLKALDLHLDEFFDNDEVVVWEDKRDDHLKINVYHIKPSESRNFHLLITSGMSRQPMDVPQGFEKWKYAELAAILPRDWDLSQEGLKNPDNYWPLLWLKNLARIPQQYKTWLSYGHSIPNGDPTQPIANTPYEGILILDSVTMPEDFQEVHVGDESLYIFTVVPVFGDELKLKIDQGLDALLEAFSKAKVPDWIFPNRQSAV